MRKQPPVPQRRVKSAPSSPSAPPPQAEDGDYRTFTREQIHDLRLQARDFPFVLFGVYELAAMIGVHGIVVTAVANHRASPFLKARKKARPEWVMDFLRNPPEDFDVPKKVA